MSKLFRKVFSTSSFGPLFFLGSLLVPLGVALYLILFAGAPIPTTSAVLSTVNNVVEVQAVDNVSGFQPAQAEQVLVAGDDVRTSQQGRGVITFADDSSLVLEPDSQLTILPPQRRGGGLINRINQSFGSSFAQFSALAAGGGRYEITTPAGVVSVRDGAILRVGVGKTQSGKATVQVVVLQGAAEVRPASAPEGSAATVVIRAGQAVTATEDEAIPEPQAFVPENDVVIRLFSPFWMLVAEPNTGLVTGLIPTDSTILQIPLSLTTAGGVSPQTVRLNDVVPGTYTIYLIPKKDGGDFRVTADGKAQNQPVFSDARAGFSGGCEWYYLTLNVDLDDDGLLNFGELQGPFRLTSVPLVFSHTVESPCPAPSPLTAQVRGAQVTPTAEPEGTATAVPALTTAPVPTEAPPAATAQATSAPPPTSVPTAQPQPTTTGGTDIILPPVEPTEAPPPPPPPPKPHPVIAIDHVEEGIGGASLPLIPLLLAIAPALLGGLIGAIKRRGTSR